MEQASQALKEAIASLPVGSFELSEKSGSSPAQKGSCFPFDFLGHRFDFESGVLFISVTEANTLKAHTELMKRMASIEQAEMKFAKYTKLMETDAKGAKHVKLMKAEIEADFLEMARYILGWENAFKAADDIGANKKELKENLELLAQQHEFLDVEKAFHAASQMPLHLIDPY